MTDAEDAQSLALLAQGRIPLRAQRRIHEVTHGQRPVFTSTLTPSETVVARQTGLTAISQVMGSSIYHVGVRVRRVRRRRARGAAARLRARAVARALAHAAGGGAPRREPRARREVPQAAASSGRTTSSSSTQSGRRCACKGCNRLPQPILTLLEPDELWKLHHAGYWPAGIAIGNSFWYEPHADCFGEGSWYSQELPTHTRAAQGARHNATERFRAFAHHLNAHGVVGVRVHRRGHDREYEVNDSRHVSFRLDLVVMGTAVVRRGEAAPPPRPGLVIDLRDLPRTRFTHG